MTNYAKSVLESRRAYYLERIKHIEYNNHDDPYTLGCIRRYKGYLNDLEGALIAISVFNKEFDK